MTIGDDYALMDHKTGCVPVTIIKQGSLYCRRDKPDSCFFYRQYQGMLKAGAMSWLDNSKTCRAVGQVRRGVTAIKSKVLAIRQSCKLYLFGQPTETTDRRMTDIYQLSA